VANSLKLTETISARGDRAGRDGAEGLRAGLKVGFILHGDSRDDMVAYTREARETKHRPAVLVIYEPK
jgi:hypothetical protein